MSVKTHEGKQQADQAHHDLQRHLHNSLLSRRILYPLRFTERSRAPTLSGGSACVPSETRAAVKPLVSSINIFWVVLVPRTLFPG